MLLQKLFRLKRKLKYNDKLKKALSFIRHSTYIVLLLMKLNFKEVRFVYKCININSIIKIYDFVYLSELKKDSPIGYSVRMESISEVEDSIITQVGELAHMKEMLIISSMTFEEVEVLEKVYLKELSEIARFAVSDYNDLYRKGITKKAELISKSLEV